MACILAQQAKIPYGQDYLRRSLPQRDVIIANEFLTILLKAYIQNQKPMEFISIFIGF